MRPLALVGTTASGKTAAALALAERFNAEILCADSMTIYRGMDIGTAKPSLQERARVPHHLLDIADPMEPFTVARFQGIARAALGDVQARGRTPLVVGGSGLYVRAALDDLRFPPTDPAVRARLGALAPAELAAQLRARDPVAAGFIEPANTRRIVRALEVLELTGRPFSTFRQEWERFTPVPVAGLDVAPEELDRRIRARLGSMLARGFLEEVRALVDAGYRDALTASKAIAYADAIALLDGTLTVEGFLESASRATRRLARRQRAWFRRDPRVRWFDGSEPERAVEGIAAYYSEHLQEER